MKRILALILGVLIVVFSMGCNGTNGKLHKTMLKKYTNEENYVSLSGKITKIERGLVEIECSELKNYLGYAGETCLYIIYSNQMLDLYEGDIIDFKTVPFQPE